MQCVFNPKDTNTFASASLDRTVKVGRTRALSASSPDPKTLAWDQGSDHQRYGSRDVATITDADRAEYPVSSGKEWWKDADSALGEPGVKNAIICGVLWLSCRSRNAGVERGPADAQLHSGGAREGGQLRRLLRRRYRPYLPGL